MNKNQSLLLVLLSVGFVVWLIVPILGIFILLLYIQLDFFNCQKTSKKIFTFNNLLLILIVFTLSIFCSSFTVYSDTESHLNTYLILDWDELFNLPRSYGNGLEFVTFLLAYPIHLLTNGSPYWFLFNHSLIINFVVVFVIGKNISNRYYPLLLIIIFSNYPYYNQVFWMRQVLSVTFLMAAVASIESRVIFWIYCLLSFFSHLSSFPYIVLLLIIKTITFRPIQKKNNSDILSLRKLNRWIKIVLIGLLIFIIFGLSFSNNIILMTVNIFSFVLQSIGLGQGSDLIGDRVENYLGANSVNPTASVYNFLSIFLLTITILCKKNIVTVKNFALLFILISQIALFIFLYISPIFNSRMIAIFWIFQGFFYSLALEETNRFLKKIVWGFAIVSFLLFLRALTSMPDHPIISGTLVFFRGNPLTTNLYDYIVFFTNAQIN